MEKKTIEKYVQEFGREQRKHELVTYDFQQDFLTSALTAAHTTGVEEGRDAFAAKVAADFRNMGSLGDSSALFVEDTLYEFRTSTSE